MIGDARHVTALGMLREVRQRRSARIAASTEDGADAV
jgi:hypothetical protein